jgi:hypothetical protein
MSQLGIYKELLPPRQGDAENKPNLCVFAPPRLFYLNPGTILLIKFMSYIMNHLGMRKDLLPQRRGDAIE